MSNATSPTRLALRDYADVLLRYLRDDRGLFALLASLLASNIAVALLTPFLAAQFIDEATQPTSEGTAPMQPLLLLAGAFLVAGVSGQLLKVATTHLGAHVAWRATNRLQTDVVRHCLGLDLAFHHEHGPGTMVERVDGDVRRLNHFFAEFFTQIVGNVVLLAGLLVVVTLVDWRLAAAFVVASGLALGLLVYLKDSASPRWGRSFESNAILYNELEERFGGVRDLRANSARDYVMRKFAERLRANYLTTRAAATFGVVVQHAGALVVALGTVAALAVAAALYLGGSISLGSVVMVSMYGAMIFAPLGAIIREVDDFQRSTAALGRVRQLLAREPTVAGGRGAGWESGPLRVECDGVSFTYPRASDSSTSDEAPPPSLHNVGFELAPGEILGVVGRTGAGKSTLARLLLRLYDPTAGRIRFDGQDIRQATTQELRRRVSVITQDVHIFDASLRSNIAVFNPAISDESILEALRQVGLLSWYRRQSEGLDTLLSSGGEGMSAGEAQLLGVARAFLVDPGLLILDEPTSRLDPVTERAFDDALASLLENRTCVIAAHRLATLARVDRILVLDQGRVVEIGERQVLVADSSSRFAALLAQGELQLVAE